MSNKVLLHICLKCVSGVFLLTTLSGCDDEGPAIVEGKPFPICKRTGQSYSKEQIYRSALVDLRSYASRMGCSANDVAKIETQKGCCQITFGINAEESDVAGLRPVNSASYQIGRFRAFYSCTSDASSQPYRFVSATVTSCGNLIETGETNAESLPPYPTRLSYQRNEE
jgi:hypothetical protein